MLFLAAWDLANLWRVELVDRLGNVLESRVVYRHRLSAAVNLWNVAINPFGDVTALSNVFWLNAVEVFADAIADSVRVAVLIYRAIPIIRETLACAATNARV